MILAINLKRERILRDNQEGEFEAFKAIVGLNALHLPFLLYSENVPEGWEKVREEAPLWRFLYPLEDSTQCIVLRSHHNKWLCAEDDGHTISNDRTKIKRWEKFEIIFSEDGFVTLKTWKGKYFSAQPNGSLEANRDDSDRWEKFEIFIHGNDNEDLAIRSTHGKWLSAQPDGRMEFDRDNLDIWETFNGWKNSKCIS